MSCVRLLTPIPGGEMTISVCLRCGSLTGDADRHTRRHAAVDTAATTLLPSDPKGQS